MSKTSDDTLLFYSSRPQICENQLNHTQIENQHSLRPLPRCSCLPSDAAELRNDCLPVLNSSLLTVMTRQKVSKIDPLDSKQSNGSTKRSKTRKRRTSPPIYSHSTSITSYFYSHPSPIPHHEQNWGSLWLAEPGRCSWPRANSRQIIQTPSVQSQKVSAAE